jgi:hypothetical protein
LFDRQAVAATRSEELPVLNRSIPAQQSSINGHSIPTMAILFLRAFLFLDIFIMLRLLMPLNAQCRNSPPLNALTSQTSEKMEQWNVNSKSVSSAQ